MKKHAVNTSGFTIPASQRGFTIIELLIATVIFSMVLILITTGVLQFTRQYYKGVISSNTQNTARIIIDDISRAIQFNSSTVYPLAANNGSQGYCIGKSKRYSFARNYQVTDATPPVTAPYQANHGLVSDNTNGCSSTTQALPVRSLTSLPGLNPRELLGENMRLANLSIVGSGDLYTVTVRVVYGDIDLLCSPTGPGGCGPSGGFVNNTDLTCKSTTGSQFCAVSELTTTVKKRVN